MDYIDGIPAFDLDENDPIGDVPPYTQQLRDALLAKTQSVEPSAFFTPEPGITIDDGAGQLSGGIFAFQLRLGGSTPAVSAGNVNEAIGDFHADYSPRVYFAVCDAWSGPAGNMSCLVSEAGGASVRWSSSSVSAGGTLLITGAFPVALP